MLDDVKNYFANFDGATNSCRTVALWVTIAMLVAFIATRAYVVVANKKSGGGEVATAALRMLNGGWIVAAITVAVSVIIAFTACYFTDVANGDDFTPITFFPLLF